MSVQAPTEVIILQPEPVGGGADQGRTNRLDAPGETSKLKGKSLPRGAQAAAPAGSELDATNKLRLTGALDSDQTAQLRRGGPVPTRHFDIELEKDQGVGPLVRAAETVLKQGNRHVVIDLSRFSQLKADDLRHLVDVRKAFVKAGGQLVVAGLQRQVEAVVKSLELERELDLAPSNEVALERIGGGDSRGRAERLGEMAIDVHEVDLSARRPDLGFVDDFRRKGPEGLTRELVVLRCDAPGVGKVAQIVRQLSEKSLTGFVIDLGGVEQLEGSAIKEVIKAQKHLEARQGWLAVANPQKAVAGLLQVMGLDKDLPTYGSRDTAVDGYRERLLGQIEERQGGGAKGGGGSQAAGDATQAAKADDTLRLKGLKGEGGAAASGQRVEPLPGGRPGELLFGQRGTAADAARQHTVTVPRVVAGAGGMAALGSAVAEVAGGKRPFVLVDLSDAGKIDAGALQALSEIRETGAEQGSTVVFSDAGPEARALAERLGLASSLDLFADEAKAAQRIAQEIADKADVSAVALRLAEHEAAEERPSKTAAFEVPDFDDEDEPSGGLEETNKLSAPSFAAPPAASERKTEEQRAVHKTASFSVPNFDDEDEDEADAAPKKTTVFGAPKFEDEDEDEGPGDAEDTDLLDESDRTALLEEPVRFKDEDESALEKTDRVDLREVADEEDAQQRPVHKTASFSVPNFDDDDDEDMPAGTGAATPVDDEVAEKPSPTAVFGAPSFEDDDEDAPFDETDRVAAPDFADSDEEAPFEKTDKVRAPALDLEEADEADARERPVHKTASFSVPSFDDDDEAEEEAPSSKSGGAAPDAEEQKPSHTAVFGAPSFEDDDDDAPFDETDKLKAARPVTEERPSHKTASFSVPSFDDEEGDEEAGEAPRPAGRTTVLSTPDFDEDEDEDAPFDETDKLKAARPGAGQPGAGRPTTEERPAHKTASFSVPSFDDEDEDEEAGPRPAGKTTVLSTPDFDEDDDDRKERAAAGKRTTLVSAPDLGDEDEDEETKKPGRTTVLSTPDFDEDDDDRKERAAAGKRTTLVSAPDLGDEDEDEDEETKKPGRTTVLSTPDFDEDDEDRKERAAAGKKTTLVRSPDALDNDRTSALAAPKGGWKGGGAGPEDTAPLSQVDYGETDKLPSVTHADTNRIQLDDEAQIEADIDAAFEDTKKLKSDADQADTGKLPIGPAAKAPSAKGLPDKPPAGRADLRGAKTEMMPGMSAAAAKSLLADTAKNVLADTAKTPITPITPPAAKPAPAAKATKGKDIQVAKTEAMDGMSRADALKQVQAMQDAAKAAAPAAKAAPPAAKAAPAGKRTGDVQASQTDRMDGMTKNEANLRGAKTEALPGLSREEARDLADPQKRKTGEVPAQDRKTGEISAPLAAPSSSKAPLLIGAVVGLLLVVGGLWYANRPKPVEPTPVVTNEPPPSSTKPDPKVVEAGKKIGAALHDAFGSE